MKKFRKITAIVLSLLMCLGLAACGQSPAEDQDGGNAEKVITLAESWDFSAGIVPVLNPGNSPNYGSIYWGRNFYDTLVSYNEEGKIVGELAEDWEVSEDGKSYTFYLREGIKFSDGSALTADAVKLSFEAAVVNLGAYVGSFGGLSALIDNIEVIDERTLIINLIQPYYGTLNDLTMSCPMAVVNPVAFEDSEDLAYGDVFKTASYGTGPYMYAGDYKDNTYTFVRNPHYWGKEPEADGFKVKVIEDNDAKLFALRNGEVDALIGTNRISFDGYAELSAGAAFGAGMNEKAGVTRFLGMNLSSEPFNDVRVRQAVAYAMDQSMLESSVFNGFETAAKTLFADTVPYCDVVQTTYDTDLEKAERLLEEAGWIDADGDGIREKDGTSFVVDLNYQTSLASVDNLALALAARLSEIGIKVNVVAGDMMTFYAAMGTSPLVLSSTYGGAFDPFTVMTNMNPAVSSDPVSMQFGPFFENGILDELNSTSSEERVRQIYEHILTTIADQSLLVPLSRAHELAIWNSDKIAGYNFFTDANYIAVANLYLK